MHLDADTAAALGYAHEAGWWADASIALRFVRSRGRGLRQSREGWTPEDWRAYWREQKRAQRKADPEAAREHDRRMRIRDGGVRWEAYVERKRRLAEQLAGQRMERKRQQARWRSVMVRDSGWTAPIERVIAGLDIDGGHR